MGAAIELLEYEQSDRLRLYVSAEHQWENDPPSKNRVWNFLEYYLESTEKISLQVSENESDAKPHIYDFVSGRLVFTSADPLGIDAFPNLYAYGDLNPLYFVDPSGEFGWVAGAISGGVAGVITAKANGGDLGDIMKSAVWGSVIGGVVGAIAPQYSHIAANLVVSAVAGAGSSYLGQATGNVITGQSFTESLTNVDAGLIGGSAVGGVLGNLIESLFLSQISVEVFECSKYGKDIYSLLEITTGVAQGVASGGSQLIGGLISNSSSSGSSSSTGSSSYSSGSSSYSSGSSYK